MDSFLARQRCCDVLAWFFSVGDTFLEQRTKQRTKSLLWMNAV